MKLTLHFHNCMTDIQITTCLHDTFHIFKGIKKFQTANHFGALVISTPLFLALWGNTSAQSFLYFRRFRFGARTLTLLPGFSRPTRPCPFYTSLRTVMGIET